MIGIKKIIIIFSCSFLNMDRNYGNCHTNFVQITKPPVTTIQRSPREDKFDCTVRKKSTVSRRRNVGAEIWCLLPDLDLCLSLYLIMKSPSRDVDRSGDISKNEVSGNPQAICTTHRFTFVCIISLLRQHAFRIFDSICTKYKIVLFQISPLVYPTNSYRFPSRYLVGRWTTSLSSTLTTISCSFGKWENIAVTSEYYDRINPRIFAYHNVLFGKSYFGFSTNFWIIKTEIYNPVLKFWTSFCSFGGLCYRYTVCTK
uniref:Signal peptide protein n=1 Tax=Heterorhabditis bacteriophora TaxID=37862 RepID=A0A1I7WHQ3_HETBA